MEARRRQTSASTQHSHDERSHTSHPPHKGSGSATPRAEDEEEAGSRRTRGRNPLPPTSGPLFPPLPPKQSKNSPKAPSRSPANRTPRLTSVSALSNAMEDDGSNADPADISRIGVPAASPTKAAAPAAATTPGSVGSLSPPPIDSDEAPKPSTMAGDNGASSNATDGDDWDAYRRGRGVRGFSGPKPPPPATSAPAVVKVESIENGGHDSASNNDGDSKDKSNCGASTSTEEQGPSASTASTTSDATSARARKRRGEEQLLLDDHLLPKEMRVHPPRREKSSKRSEPLEEPAPSKEEEEPPKEEEPEEAEADADEYEEDDSSEEITRCVCKREDVEVMMICCDKCKVWQHGECMGIWGDEEAPDEYFCEECRPDLHVALRKWIRSRGRNPANFIAPTPADLQKLHNASDKQPPSQSKRWTDPELMEPPPPPVKLPSRSHHKKDKEKEKDKGPKEKEPADDDASDRRSARARGKETSGRDRERGASISETATAKESSVRDSKRRNRRVSTDLSLSTSPPPGVPRPEPKKRSTMNSRDAAYEEAVKAALEASRREMSGGLEKDEQTVDEPRTSKRRRAEDDEGEEAKKITKKKKEEETEPIPAAPAKAKHPNQYTYRPKPGSSVTPARRGAGTPQPSAPPAHEHGTRRAGAIANNLAQAPYTPVSIYNLNWYLPDHLSAFHDLLPTPNPEPLIVPTPRSLQFLPRNHFLGQTYGPFSEDKTEDGKLIMPEDRPLRGTDGEAVNHREPPTRVRYPIKRVTTGEMRKRVRNMLEYVGRVQVDETRRLERARLIKIPTESAPRPRLPPLEDELNGITRHQSKSAGPDDDVEMREPSLEPPRAPLPSSSQLLDELTRDLIAFQEAFQTGDFDSLSFVAPPPPELPESTAEPESGAQEAQAEANGDGAEAETAVEPETAVDESLEVKGEADQSQAMDVDTVPREPAKLSEDAEPPVSEPPEVKPAITPEAAAEAETPAEAEALASKDVEATSVEPVTPADSDTTPIAPTAKSELLAAAPAPSASPRKGSEVTDPPVAVTA